jgi:beta-lactamase class A
MSDANRMLDRRLFVMGATGLAALASARLSSAADWPALNDELAKIEAQSGGRLGIAVLDTGSGRMAGHRADERFPMCSTFKLLAVAAVLKRVDDGRERLDRRITFEASDLETYSPVTKDHAGQDGMTMAQLCSAAIIWSDNTAANLILASLGGPQGVTAYAHSIGDMATRLDRTEPTLNEAIPVDLRDTTTPIAMLKDVQALTLGSALSTTAREHLSGWLLGNRTGDARLRAGLPSGWRCGDKTGTGERGTANDVGVLWASQGAPVIVSAYLTESTAKAATRDAALADVARAVVSSLKR